MNSTDDLYATASVELELIDFGDTTAETKQWMYAPNYADSAYIHGWLPD